MTDPPPPKSRLPEVMDLRFNRYLWQFKDGLTKEALAATKGKPWTYFLTLENLESLSLPGRKDGTDG